MKKTTVAYYTGLALIVLVFAAGGITNLYMIFSSSAKEVLGYPPYFTGILGIAQLLGVICLLLPRLDRFKEWAFAGFYVNLISALISHLVVEGLVPVIGVIIFILGILTGTYILFHKKRSATITEQEFST